MYTRQMSQTIYSYTLDAGQEPVKVLSWVGFNGQFTIPFHTDHPLITFNIQLRSLEIIGDWWDSTNKNHQLMNTAGIFSEAPDPLFDGEMTFEVAYSKNVGTLILSGSGHSGYTQVYIVTQNSNWNNVESSNKFLSPFHNPSGSDLMGFGAVEHENKVYIIGGWTELGYQNTIQSIDFTGVETLQDAKTKKWIFMANLKNSVNHPAVVYSNERLLVVGATDTGSASICGTVQYLDLAFDTTGVYSHTIDCGFQENIGLRNPGMYSVAGGDVSIFGGSLATKNCIQQTASIARYDLASTWNCITSSDSALEGLEYSKDGTSIHIRYSNFVL